MRQLLNTLYVTTPESYIHKDGQNLVITNDKKELLSIPAHNVESIVSFTYAGVSPGAMRLCNEMGISICFISPHGQYIGRFVGPKQGNVLLHVQQTKILDSQEKVLNICKIIVSGMIYNQRAIIQRYIRDYGSLKSLTLVSNELKSMIRMVQFATNNDEVRGYEGKAAAKYFSIFNIMIRQSEFTFNGRTKRPPKDAVNTMLSFVYTLIAHEVESALETVGLDPYIGYLHSLRPGRSSLALDLMEEFRAYWGDRFVLSLINLRIVTISDFQYHIDEQVLLTDKGRKKILTQWQKRKKEILMHPYLNEKVVIGLLPYTQAMLFARYLRGDLDNYPIFVVK